MKSLVSTTKDLQISETSSGCPAIDQLIESFKTLHNDDPAEEHLGWVPPTKVKVKNLIQVSPEKAIYY
ncbi:9021_t:CDS:1, partial [Paraglomus brasilianum]